MPVSGLRAPRQNGAILAEPPLDEIPAVIDRNRQTLRQVTGSILGRDFQQLRRDARRSAVESARAYLRQAGEPPLLQDADSLILAGHQPELFHPGVWVKNFALNRIAREAGALPVNLVVDNDVVKTTALTVPQVHVPLPPLDEFTPGQSAVPFDHTGREMPYEERGVEDEDLFASLPGRMDMDWGYRPLLPDFWQEVLRKGEATPLLGERFAAARRTFERAWGCHNLEIPISRLCRTEPFVWFFCHLINDLPRFHELYNRTVRDYRHRYGLRSRNHPVPDLAVEGDWLETPFWAWQAGQPRRGRLFALCSPETIALRVGHEVWPTLQRGAGLLATARALFASTGYKIRSRALTNTLYARVFLCDLFIHGLGGGKYDELTDQLIREFYHLDPPGYLVLSATLLLPLPHYPASAAECDRLQRQLRDLHYNPQRHTKAMTGADGKVQELIQRKDELIHLPYHGIWEREQRFAHLKEVTAKLRSYLGDAEEVVRREVELCQRGVAANRVLSNRDFAFCLHPESTLRLFVTQFL